MFYIRNIPHIIFVFAKFAPTLKILRSLFVKYVRCEDLIFATCCNVANETCMLNCCSQCDVAKVDFMEVLKLESDSLENVVKYQQG